MRIDAALLAATARLRRSKNDTARLDAEVILSLVLGVTREHLATYPEQQLTTYHRERFRRLMEQRERGVPVAYLTGIKEFFGLAFAVNRHVLIPRPESEALVETILTLVPKKQAVTIADIGTGSGNLAIALAYHLPHARVFAVDQSNAALTVARRNATLQPVRVHFRRGDLLSPLSRIHLDVIVSNLPYLPRGKNSWVGKVRTDQLKHEPAQSLYSDANGLGHYRKLLGQIGKRRRLPMLVVCETDIRQTKQFTALVSRLLPSYRHHTRNVNGVAIAQLEKNSTR